MENLPLQTALDAEICHQVRVASNDTPRYVVLGRVIETVCSYINIPVTSLPDYKNSIHLTPDLKLLIEACWYSQLGDNHEELEKILAKDYHKPSDIIRFISLLVKRETKNIQTTPPVKLYELLAVDGYLGDDLKRYVEYLKCDDIKFIHVHAIRQLYREGIVQTPQETYSILQAVFGLHPCENEEAKIMYTTLVGDALHAIHEWKMQQSQEELKRKESGTTRKRKQEPSEEEQPPKKPRGRKNKNPKKLKTPDVGGEGGGGDPSSSSNESETENS